MLPFKLGCFLINNYYFFIITLHNSSYSTELKFPCPMMGHKHEVSKYTEFFELSPEDRWEKLEKGKICFSYLKPRGVCKLRICVNHPKVPKVMKCTQCALWAESKGMAPFSIFFCKRKGTWRMRAPLSELKSALEKYIGKRLRIKTCCL